MKDQSLDEVDITCPVCRKTWKGKHVNNPFQVQGICDWCVIPMMLKGQTFPEQHCETWESGPDGKWRKTGELTIPAGECCPEISRVAENN